MQCTKQGCDILFQLKLNFFSSQEQCKKSVDLLENENAALNRTVMVSAVGRSAYTLFYYVNIQNFQSFIINIIPKHFQCNTLGTRAYLL